MQLFESSSVFPRKKVLVPDAQGLTESMLPAIEECNVLLVNPSINPNTQNPILTSIIRTSFPMSLAHVAGYLERQGLCKIFIIDELYAIA